jgi:RimJ/RimL family protein N-acetyltransferase
MGEMKLLTERLVLRGYTINDTKDILKIFNQKKVMKWIHGIPYPCTLNQLKKIFNEEDEEGAHYFAIVHKEKKKIIGSIWLRHIEEDTNCKIAELGYLIDEEEWGKGYATEAICKLISWGFKNLKLNKIYAKTCSENSPSKWVLKKFKFKLEGRLRKHFNIRFVNKWCDEEIYGLLKEEWKK